MKIVERAIQVKMRITCITNLVLGELPPARAEVFLARLHHHLPENLEDITQVLNGVHENLHAEVRLRDKRLLQG